jgi:uncharacterized protein YceK
MNRKKYVVPAALIALTLLLTGCSSVLSSISGEVTLDTAKVQQSIVDGIPGDTRNCVATALIDGSTAKVVVTIESSQGDITWEMQ